MEAKRNLEDAHAVQHSVKSSADLRALSKRDDTHAHAHDDAKHTQSGAAAAADAKDDRSSRPCSESKGAADDQCSAAAVAAAKEEARAGFRM